MNRNNKFKDRIIRNEIIAFLLSKSELTVLRAGAPLPYAPKLGNRITSFAFSTATKFQKVISDYLRISMKVIRPLFNSLMEDHVIVQVPDEGVFRVYERRFREIENDIFLLSVGVRPKELIDYGDMVGKVVKNGLALKKAPNKVCITTLDYVVWSFFSGDKRSKKMLPDVRGNHYFARLYNEADENGKPSLTVRQVSYSFDKIELITEACSRIPCDPKMEEEIKDMMKKTRSERVGGYLKYTDFKVNVVSLKNIKAVIRSRWQMFGGRKYAETPLSDGTCEHKYIRIPRMQLINVEEYRTYRWVSSIQKRFSVPVRQRLTTDMMYSEKLRFSALNLSGQSHTDDAPSDFKQWLESYKESARKLLKKRGKKKKLSSKKSSRKAA